MTLHHLHNNIVGRTHATVVSVETAYNNPVYDLTKDHPILWINLTGDIVNYIYAIHSKLQPLDYDRI